MTDKNRQKILTVIESAIANLQLNEDKINKLNVFPVPDGDTGSNMLSTLISAWNEIGNDSKSDIDILKDFSRGALYGARGNSGVITSQIIKGVYEGIKKTKKFSYSSEDLKIILSTAKDYAYKSVLNPVEGTILSVIRKLDSNFKRDAKDIVETFEILYKISKDATNETKNELEILKEANVVDSGAYGLAVIFEGCLKALKGNPLKLDLKLSNNNHIPKNEKFIKADAIKNIGYCTEFILTLKNPKKFDREDFQKKLEKIGGDSIVIIFEDDILKVHVHVKKPGEVFNLAQKYGEFSKIKSENMASQATEAGHNVLEDKAEYKFNDKNINDKLFIISVSNGVGFNKEFKNLGVDEIINGGQSMNPSVNDFIKLINKVPNKNILILPNNSNIILTVDVVKKNITNKNIFTLPTKSLQQGIISLLNINKEMINFDEFKDDILEEINLLKEGHITTAIRNTKMNQVNVKKGEYISIFGKEIISSNSDIIVVFEELLEKIIDDNLEIITVFYNEKLNNIDIERVKKIFKDKYNHISLEIKYGGQSVYEILLYGE